MSSGCDTCLDHEQLGLAPVDEAQRARRLAGRDEHLADERAIRHAEPSGRQSVDVRHHARVVGVVQRADHGDAERGVVGGCPERVEQRSQHRLVHGNATLTQVRAPRTRHSAATWPAVIRTRSPVTPGIPDGASAPRDRGRAVPASSRRRATCAESCTCGAICSECGAIQLAIELPAIAAPPRPIPRAVTALVGAAGVLAVVLASLPTERATDRAINRVRNARFAACKAGVALDAAAPAHVEIVDAIAAASRAGFDAELGNATELLAIDAAIETADAASRPALARRWRAVLGCG
jgi:hypothetical protein